MNEGQFSSMIKAGTVDLRPAIDRTARLCSKMLHKVGLVGLSLEAQLMKVDTGYSRGHLSYAMGLDGQSVKFGILSPFNNADGAGVALYPAMMNFGIKRHFVSFFNRDGSLREMLIKWCERHGIKVWKSNTGKATRRRTKGSERLIELGMGNRVMAMRGIRVWGYAHPWRDEAQSRLMMVFPNLLREECENKL